MRTASRLRQRLAALALLGAFLLGFPLVALPTGEWGGLPATFAYVFGAWAVLIGLAAWISESRNG